MTEEMKSKRSWKLLYALLAGIVFLAVCYLATGSQPGSHFSKRSSTTTLMVALNTASEAYLTDNGAWPIKIDSADIYAILSGADSGKVYLTIATRNISLDGKYMDDWGTPLRVTRISDTELKIESAGPDKIFGTADDITN